MYCLNCRFFIQPKCSVYNTFKARKTESCEEFKLNKKVNIPKKIEIKKKTDEEIKNDILGELKSGPECPKMNRSKTQRRR